MAVLPSTIAEVPHHPFGTDVCGTEIQNTNSSLPGSHSGVSSLLSVQPVKSRSLLSKNTGATSSSHLSPGMYTSERNRHHSCTDDLRQHVQPRANSRVEKAPSLAEGSDSGMTSLSGRNSSLSCGGSASGRNRLERLQDLISQRRRRLAPHCRQLIRGRTFQLVMFTALLCALFLPDVWILVDVSDNTDLDMILTIVLVAFIFELIAQTIGLTKSYFGSFFFWMDLLGAASLLLDLTYLPFATLLSGGSGGSGSAANNVVIMRAARIAKLGARAGRFTRLVKLLRFLPGMRNEGTDAGTAKFISARLITALSTRISCLIILTVMVMPMFGMWTYPEQDWSMKSWLDVLDKTATLHPERLEVELKKLEVFYSALDHYPWRVRAKGAGKNSIIEMSPLPWASSRGAPRRLANSVEFESDHIRCDYNFEKPNQIDSLMNILLLIVIMVLMVGFSLVLSNSVSAIVLRPLEKLLMQVRAAASTIFQSVTDMAVTMRNEDLAEEKEDEVVDEEDGQAVSFGNETVLLEKVVQKLAVLSEITMSKSVVDAETMQALGEGDKAVIRGYQGGQGADECSVWGDEEDTDAFGNYETMLAAQRAIVLNAGLSLEIINSWNLNALELDKARNHAAAVYFLGPHNHGIQFDPVAMGAFLEAAELAYIKTCPYHNWFHAVDVTHCVYRLFQICAVEVYLSNAERYALLVSSISHDVGHPGLNNTFLIETSHELALRYNDNSPLENMHCAKLFEFINQPKCNIFASLSTPQFQEIRKLCLEAILHTDNAQHFAMIKEVQMIYEVNAEILDASWEYFRSDPDVFPTREAVDCFKQAETRKLLVNLLLHVSDISNSSKPFRICRVWAWQVLEEFFMQGDAEKRLGVPVQALNDREKVNRPFSQIGFIEFLVSPLFFAVMPVLPPTQPLVEQMIRNAKTWHQHWQSETISASSDQEKRALDDRIAKLDQRFQAAISI